MERYVYVRKLGLVEIRGKNPSVFRRERVLKNRQKLRATIATITTNTYYILIP